MKLFSAKRQPATRPRGGMIYELERLTRRLRALPLVAPVLLLVGMGAGNLTNRALDLPDDAVVRMSIEKEIPRVRLDALSATLSAMNADGKKTEDVVTMYREHVEPVERVLKRRGISAKTARRISWPLVQESYDKNLDPATVVAVMLIESEGKPTARSFVGARGLMQVMPSWLGTWRRCGQDLYDIEDNLCNGTSILAWYLKNHGTEQQALLGYNGCVRGTNTPRCHTYPNKIWSLREQVKREIAREKASIAKHRAAD